MTRSIRTAAIASLLLFGGFSPAQARDHDEKTGIVGPAMVPPAEEKKTGIVGPAMLPPAEEK